MKGKYNKMNTFKKYAIWIKMGSKIQFHDIGIIFDLIVMVVFRYIFLSFLWSSIFKYNEIANWTMNSYKIYIGSSVFLSCLISYPNIYFMSLDMRSGNIINYLIKPTYYPYHVIYKNIGIAASNVLILAPVFIIYLSFSNTNITAENLFWFVLLAIMGVFTYILFDILMGLLTFWFENSWGLNIVKQSILTFFSGSMFPLDFLPKQLNDILKYSPFPGIIYRPTTILINGSYNNLFFLFLQIAWILIFLILIRVIFRSCEKDVIIYGG